MASQSHAHDDHGDHGHDDDYHVHSHISPVKLYLGIIAALFCLTGLTVGAYNVQLGEWNLAVAILIATIKSSLVVTYFMHMKWETKFNILVFLGSIVVGGIFLVYTLNDTGSRGDVDPHSGTPYDIYNGDNAFGRARDVRRGDVDEFFSARVQEVIAAGGHLSHQTPGHGPSEPVAAPEGEAQGEGEAPAEGEAH